MTELQSLLLELEKQLQCPVDWDRVVILPAARGQEDDAGAEVSNPGLCSELRWYWREIAEAHAVSGETDYLAVLYLHPDESPPDFLYEDGDEEQIRSDLKNIAEWINDAKKLYIEKTRPLANMKFATSADQQKHYPPAGLRARQIRSRTRNGVSLFFNGVQAQLPMLMWSVFEVCWRDVLERKHLRVHADCINPIGAAYGQDTKYVCLDVDSSTPITHAFPVPEREIPKEERVIAADEMQGFAIIDD